MKQQFSIVLKMKVGISILVYLLVINTSLVNGSCPSVCSCSSPYQELIVDCQSRALKNIPADLLNDTLHLWLQNNNITVIDVQFCKKMPQLKQVQLYNNQISTLELFTFMNLPSLRFLHVFNNKIQFLESYTFINLTNVAVITLNGNNISHIEEHAFGKLTSLSTLDLESNPLNCDCTIYPFWSWLVVRPSTDHEFACISCSATCSNGTLVTSLQVAALTKCNPVKCYECHEVDEPRLCTNVTQCPNIDHYCFATRSFADNFKKIYKLGCAPKSICKENFGSPGKRDLRVDAACCSDDQCNNRFPEEIQGSSYTTSTKEPTETSSTIKECQNIDEDICTRIAALYPGFCINESCAAAKLCPRMCRQCFRCYSCNEVDNVKDCNVTALCQGTKQCFSMETLSMDDLRPVIRLGCMETKTCQRFTASPGIIFGKRQSLQPKGGCCHSDLCNHNLASSLTTQKTIPTPSPTTTTATPRPTVNSCNLNFQSQCPTGYIAHNNFCYLFGTVSMSWNDAKNYCTRHCGSLIDFVSDNEMGHTMRYFLRYGPGHLHIDGSYWSAATTHLGSVWVWDSTGKHLTSDFTHDLGTTRFGQCGSVHHHLESTSCASRFPPACKTTIRSG